MRLALGAPALCCSLAACRCRRHPHEFRSTVILLILGLVCWNPALVSGQCGDGFHYDSDCEEDYGATVELEEESSGEDATVVDGLQNEGDHFAAGFSLQLTHVNSDGGSFNGEDGQPFALDASVIQARIVGGSAVSSEQYPYAVLLGHGDRIKCAGSLVAPNVVITAGHCRGAQSVLVQDSERSSSMGSGFRSFAVRREKRHPEYSSEGLDFDISVLHLRDSVDNATPVIMDDGTYMEEIDPGDDLMVVGWGSDSESGEGQTQLHAAYVGYVDQSVCNRRYRGLITDRMMCFGGKDRDACAGDSGGPLIKRGSRRKLDVQVGIVSWGVGCARRGYPGVYVRMHEVRGWVQSVLNEWNVQVPQSSANQPPSPASTTQLPVHTSTAPLPSYHATVFVTPSVVFPILVSSVPESPNTTLTPHADHQHTPTTPLNSVSASRPADSPPSPNYDGVERTIHPLQVVCPQGSWYVVEWQLHVPYDSEQWESRLMSAARASLVARLNGLPPASGLLRLKRMELDDDMLRTWESSDSTCPSPTLTASFWLHFTVQQYANIFKDWLRSADEWLLPPIFKAVPDLCGARMSTNNKLILKTYCVVPHSEDGSFSYEYKQGNEFTSSTTTSDDD